MAEEHGAVSSFHMNAYLEPSIIIEGKGVRDISQQVSSS